MRVVQLLPNFTSKGDAVSNDCLSIKEVIQRLGYKTDIYAEFKGKEPNIRHISELAELSRDDVLIYHCSIGWPYISRIKSFPCYKIMRYHNITPPHFFEGYNPELKKRATEGYEELHFLKNTFDYCLADSEYNRENLISMGYSCDIDVLPVLIPFDKYDQQPCRDVISKYSQTAATKLLFAGRIAPNKKIEDIIQAFFYYKTVINKNSMLFLVGSYSQNDIYFLKLQQIVKTLYLNDVIFLGHIPFKEVLAYYKLADAFVCMSEHEGFCVPLLEAMHFNVPVIAYDSTAVTHTLGESGILFKNKNYSVVSEAMHQVVSNLSLREGIIKRQQKRLQDFSYPIVSSRFEKILISKISKKKE